MHGQTVQGVNNGRCGATMTLQTADTPKLVVLLTPTTEVGEVQGASKARTKQYVIQVKGYASAVGSASLNQRLSVERANAVTQYLEQDANVPLTNMLAPGAMGTADQVAPDKTTEGQAQNRRVVVMILQNKGIAGT
jgi:hypothetical protein